MQDSHQPRIQCPGCPWTVAAGRKSLLRRHMDRIHPELGSDDNSDFEIQQRCAKFKDELAAKKRERREKFEEEVEEERKRRKEEAAEERSIAVVEWPVSLPEMGYHPVAGNMSPELGETPAYTLEEPEPEGSQMVTDISMLMADQPADQTTDQPEVVPEATSEEDGDTKTGQAGSGNSTEEDKAMMAESENIRSEENRATEAEPEMGVQPPTKQTEDVGVQCGRYPCGEGVDEFQPRYESSCPSGAPHYQLKIIDVNSQPEGGTYDQWHKDPRLLFLAAPSTYRSDYPAAMLREARRQALYQPGRPVTRVIPHGTAYIERTESVELQDGRTYRLWARWFEDRAVCDCVQEATQCTILND